MHNLLTLHYWFNSNPPALIPIANTLFILLLIALIFLLIISTKYKKKSKIYKTFWRRVNNFSLSNFFIGLVFLFFNYESVPFFSARFWLGLWALMMLVWIIIIIKELKKIPQRKEEIEKKKEFKKYLP